MNAHLKEAQRAIEKVINRTLDKGRLKQDVDSKRTTQLRVSGFPFCGLEWFLDLPKGLSSARKVDPSFAYFTRVGTTVHEVIQSLLVSVIGSAKKVRLLGDWVCPDCKKVHKFQVRPDKCKNCMCENLQFEEVSLSHRVVPNAPKVNGHIDTLFLIEIDGVDYLFVLDYKTCTLSALKAKDRLPYLSNACQVKGYVGILHDMGVNVSEYAFLVYLPRDNPFKFKVIPVKTSFKKQKALLVSYVKDFKRVSTMSSLEDVKSVVRDRKCADSLDPLHCECKWAKYCAGKKNSDGMMSEAKRVFKIVQDKLPVNRPYVKDTPS